MPYIALLTLSLYAFWLVMSGFWDNPLLLTLGAVSTALVAWLSWRIEKHYPFHSFMRVLANLPRYWPWLVWEVVKSNADVLKRIWLPSRYPIDPAQSVLPMSQQSRIGRTIYANSITLTPGTIAVRVDGDKVLVHALHSDSIRDLEQGEMDRRVTALEGKSA
jgi:multicomponent Na+:H+ antiporter subunit E